MQTFNTVEKFLISLQLKKKKKEKKKEKFLVGGGN